MQFTELEEKSIGDMVFQVNKSKCYQTSLRYWFSKPGFDCVKDGRWIPWNPTIEIVLKEKRAPKPLYTKEVESVFPKRESVGFDCLAADFVEPFGKGTIADFYLHYDSVVPLNGVTLLDWSYLTNNLTISSAGGGGFITKSKDIFSKMISEYEAPEKGYTDTVNYELKRTRDKIFMDRKLDNAKYLFFKSRVKRIGEAESANYGKIYELKFGESLKNTNTATLRMTYYFNPTPNDRNLEFDETNNLFRPRWKDSKWPREP